MTELYPVEFKFEQFLDWDVFKYEALPRMKYASKLEIPHLPQLQIHTGKCAVVGAAPSVVNYLDEIKAIKEGHEFNTVMTINGAHDWFIKQGVTPRIHVICEEDIEDVRHALGGDPVPGVAYYVCSTCPQKVFQQLEGYHRVLWHAFFPWQEYQIALNRYFKGEFMVGSGYTTFFKTIVIAIILGFRDFDLFGVDCSFEGSSHVDGYTFADIEPKIDIWGSDPEAKDIRKFKSQGGYVFQAHEFLQFCKINHAALKLRVHGDGLLRFVHASRYPEQYEKGN